MAEQTSSKFLALPAEIKTNIFRMILPRGCAIAFGETCLSAWGKISGVSIPLSEEIKVIIKLAQVHSIFRAALYTLYAESRFAYYSYLAGAGRWLDTIGSVNASSIRHLSLGWDWKGMLKRNVAKYMNGLLGKIGGVRMLELRGIAMGESTDWGLYPLRWARRVKSKLSQLTRVYYYRIDRSCGLMTLKFVAESETANRDVRCRLDIGGMGVY